MGWCWVIFTKFTWFGGIILVDKEKAVSRRALRRKSHMPENSIFFEKLIPMLLIGLAVVMGGLILFAAGVLLGFVSF